MRGLYYRSTPLEKPWESVSIDTAHGRYAKLGELLGAIQREIDFSNSFG